MKSVTKLVMGAAVVAASLNSVAHAAISLPSTDNSQLLFFVSDTSNNSTYTVVLNQDINGATGIFKTSDATSAATPGTINTINGKSNFSVSFTGDTALSTFLGNTGDTYTYGIVGFAYTGAAPATRGAAGKVLYVGSSSNATSPLSIGEGNIVNGSLTSYTTDVRALNNGSLDAFNGTTSGVIGTPASQGGTNLTSLYGTGLKTDTSAIGTSYGLYGFTGNGGTSGTAVAFSLGTLSFDGTTLSFVGNVAPVPLPAAAWLLGSGLLGLLGVGRRRDVSAAA